MTLDEAIKHCEEIAMDKTNLAQTLWDSKEKARCEDCAEEHNQLAQWIIELKMLKTEQEPKTGHWKMMYEPENMVVCSECGKCAYLYNGRTSTWCPHCGNYKGVNE